MRTLKKGISGSDVQQLQEFLGLLADGEFGPNTEKYVKKWQEKQGLVADGIVGPKTWEMMALASTDGLETIMHSDDFQINEYFLPDYEYRKGPINPRWVFLHHTAGWHKPKAVVNGWKADKRGPVGTEFVIGGVSVKGDDFSRDGNVIQAFPHKNYGWHLGKNGNQSMHKNSVAIELCNFGYLELGGYHKWDAKTKKYLWIPKDPSKYYTYSGASADDSQIVHLASPFRGYKTWHRYSDKQIEALRNLLIYIGDRDNIDIKKGLPELIDQLGAKAFEFTEDAYYGIIEGVWSHSNVRKDKFDIFPQQEMMDMLRSL